MCQLRSEPSTSRSDVLHQRRVLNPAFGPLQIKELTEIFTEKANQVQHLFCVTCYRQFVCPGWPDVALDTRSCCSVCQTSLALSDVAEVKTCEGRLDTSNSPGVRNQRVEGKTLVTGVVNTSTKIKTLLEDLVQFSKLNPYSINYDPTSIEIQLTDGQGNRLDDVVKTVVLYVTHSAHF